MMSELVQFVTIPCSEEVKATLSPETRAEVDRMEKKLATCLASRLCFDCMAKAPDHPEAGIPADWRIADGWQQATGADGNIIVWQTFSDGWLRYVSPDGGTVMWQCPECAPKDCMVLKD